MASKPKPTKQDKKTKKGKVKVVPKLCSIADEIPLYIMEAIAYLENNGLETQGIFRLSGNVTEVNELKKCWETGKPYDLSQVSEISVISSALKAFFRDMPEPLLTFELYESFITAISIQDSDQERLECIKSVIRKLPTNNRVLLARLMGLLVKIDSKSSINNMTASNLAIVWTPNLLRPRNETIDVMFGQSTQSNSLIEEFITNYKEIFPAKPQIQRQASFKPRSAHAKAFMSTLRRGTQAMAANLLQEMAASAIIQKKNEALKEDTNIESDFRPPSPRQSKMRPKIPSAFVKSEPTLPQEQIATRPPSVTCPPPVTRPPSKTNAPQMASVLASAAAKQGKLRPTPPERPDKKSGSNIVTPPERPDKKSGSNIYVPSQEVPVQRRAGSDIQQRNSLPRPLAPAPVPTSPASAPVPESPTAMPPSPQTPTPVSPTSTPSTPSTHESPPESKAIASTPSPATAKPRPKAARPTRERKGKNNVKVDLTTVTRRNNAFIAELDNEVKKEVDMAITEIADEEFADISYEEMLSKIVEEKLDIVVEDDDDSTDDEFDEEQ